MFYTFCRDVFIKIAHLHISQGYSYIKDRRESRLTIYSDKQITLSILFSISEIECDLPGRTADLQNNFTYSGCILAFIVQEMNGAVE